MKPYPEH